MLRLGDQWPREEGRRKLGLVSMPCDSGAAGLVALGSVISDLRSCVATDLHSHRAQLLNFARRYLGFCRGCKYKCKPDIRGCGFEAEASGIVKHFQPSGKALNGADARTQIRKYEVSDRTDFHSAQLAFERDGVVVWPSEDALDEWQIDGLPQIKSVAAESKLPKHYYDAFLKRGDILENNLAESYSGSCLAGRATGRTATQEAYSKLCFRTDNDEVFTLVDALPIHGWTTSTISRLVFFNTRTRECDRHMQKPLLVIADGNSAFRAARGHTGFKKSDIIGIINRTSDADQLEDLGAVLAELMNWYEPDEDAMAGLPNVPKGIAAVILRRKS